MRVSSLSHRHPLIRAAALAFATFLVASLAAYRVQADPSDPLGILATTDLTTFVPSNDPALTDPGVSDPSTQSPPHLSLGGPYHLFGSAFKARDPQNPFNEVILFDTTSTTAVAGAFRQFGDHVQATQLTDQIELKYFFFSGTCGAGSPRVQLAIDGDGDSNFQQVPGGPDQNIFGYLGDKPFGGGCLQNQWIHEDMTDAVAKWDLSQWVATGKVPACDMTCTWSQVVMYFQTNWPNHKVLNANLVSDSASFFAPGQGCAYFDLVNTGARTFTNWNDASGGQPNTSGCPGGS